MKTKLSLRLILFAFPLITLLLLSNVFTRSESNYMKSFENDDFSGTYQGTHYMYPEEGETSESPITITLTQNGNSIDAVYVQKWKTGDKKGETTWSCTGTIDSNGYFDLEGVIGTTAKFYDDGRISGGEWNSNWIWESLSDGREVYGYIIATRLDETTTSTTTTTISNTTTSCHPDNVCGDACCKEDEICHANYGCIFWADIRACVPEAIYGEYSEEVELLRNFRDNVLNKSPVGQELIELYYQWSPTIVRAMEADEEFKEEAKEMIDGILPLISRETE